MRLKALLFASLLALGACDKQATAPLTPVDEIDIATSVSAQAQAAMGGPSAAPNSVLRSLVQQIRSGDNERAKAQLARAVEISQEAAQTQNRELAQQAHALVVQVVASVFPNASARIVSVTRTGLDRARAALGNRDAPRITGILDQIGALLRQSNAAHEAGREGGALDAALRASEMLGKLVDHVRNGGTPPTR